MNKTRRSALLIGALPPFRAAAPAGAADALNKDAPLVLWLPGNGGVSGYEEGASENSNQFIDAIREATGYKNLTVSVMPATDSANAMNLLLASGEYPDAIYVNGNREFFLRYLAEGLWAPVDEVVAQYGPAIDELVTPEAWATVLGDDGLHYGIPNPMHTSYNGHLLGGGILVRKDWMDAYGLQPATDAEGFKAMLQAVKAADPTGDGSIIPYSIVGTEPSVLMAAFGMWRPYAVVDGELQNTRRLYLKDYLAYMNGLYTEGLLDPEFLYQTGANRTEKYIGGKVFAMDEGVWSKTIRQTWASTGYEGENAFLPVFQNIDGTAGTAQAFAVANCYMLLQNSKHQAEIVDLINTFLTDTELENFVNFGVENVHYKVNEQGAYEPLKPEYDKIIYKIYYRLWFKPDVWWHNAVLGDFDPEIKLWADARPDGDTNVNIFGYMPTSEASLNYKSACDDIYNEYMAKIIVGDYTVDAVDEMFKAMEASGYLEIEEAAKAWYENTGAALEASLAK